MLQVTDAGVRAIGVEPDAERPTLMMEVEEEEELDRQQEALEAEEAAGEAVPQPTGAPPGPSTPQMPAPTCLTLREAATVLLEAWDACLERPALPTFIEALRAALGRRIGQGRTALPQPHPEPRARAPSSRPSSPSCAGLRAPPSPRSWTRPVRPSTPTGASRPG